MNKFFSAALLIGAAIAAYAEPISLTKLHKFSTCQDGIIKINGVGHGVVNAFADMNIDKPTKIKMKMRRVNVSEKPGHFGIEVYGGEDNRAHFYTQEGASFIAALYQGKTRTYGKGSKGVKDIFPAKADAPWVDFEIYVQPKLTEIHVGGNPQGFVNGNLLPIKTLGIYGYHNDIEIKDLEWTPLPEAEEISADPNPSFTASFDNGFSGLTANGELVPTKAVNLETVPGVSGQAVRIAGLRKAAKEAPQLEYPVESLFANHGTLMFWIKSDWDGAYTGNIPMYPMLSGLDAEGKEKLSVSMTWWISFGLGRTGTLKPEEMKRNARSSWYRGDWNHVSMVWSDGGWCKAYLNGLPYQQPFGFNGNIFTNLDQKAITRLRVGMGQKSAEATFDELKVYRRPLSNGEIYDEYRKFMPIDLLVDRAVFNAGKSDEVVALAAPGGYYMRPMPAERSLSTGNVKIKMRLLSEDGNVVAEKDFSLEVTGPTELKLPVENLPAGKYRLKCDVAQGQSVLEGMKELVKQSGAVGTIQRTFEMLAYQSLEAMPAGDDDIQLGEIVFSKDFKDGKILESGGVKTVHSQLGDYIEAGDRNGNRFAFEVPFPEKCFDGRPVVLEIEWPDDKPRSMGLYMYPESKGAQSRDRLGGGIQSGAEFPLTGKMQKTRYLFYPGLKSYLFEARTMIGKFPAAIASFRIYEIKNSRLPKLAINYPDNLPPRRFGYCDEDETFDQNLGWDYKDVKDKAQAISERLLDYLDYTGQNAWQYPFMRYNGYNFPMEGALHNGLYPYRADAFRYMIDAMERRGKTTIAGINLYALPDMKLLPDLTEEYVKKGWALTKYSDPPLQPGNQSVRPNHANPEVRALIAGHVAETARRYAGTPGFDGVNITARIGFYKSLDEGYDDYTVNLFSKESGVQVDAKNPTDRFAYLTQEPQLSKWLKWRDSQSLELIRLIRTKIDKVNPEMKLYLNVPAIPSQEFAGLYEQIKSIAGVNLVPARQCTEHRNRLHWGKPSNGCNDMLYNPAEAAKLMNGKFGFVDSAPTYFESFSTSLKNDIYASYFQSADVKPFGRYFLKELAFAVFAMDAHRILIGAQPLGTWGRDLESREFAKAYCALPALPFENAPGAQDPVTVRYLNTEKGSYIYAVSMLYGDCECTLTLSSKSPIKDLSTGQMIANGQLKLKPFELRSFYSDDSKLKVVAVRTVAPTDVVNFYREQLEMTQNAIGRLTAEKIDCSDAEAVLVTMQDLMKKGQFAEIHRLLYSLTIREVIDKSENFQNISEQAAMIRRGHYAVNCGSSGFYRAKNGTLFFPDCQKGKGDYGHVGSYLNVVRNIEGIKADDPELFMSEAYAVDSYKFKVTPGKYKVRLYLKAGYKKAFKPDTFIFNVDVQGKRVLDNFDVVIACNSDFSEVAIRDFSDVEVKNDLLEIKFTTDGKRDPSVKLVNAIEVIRQ